MEVIRPAPHDAVDSKPTSAPSLPPELWYKIFNLYRKYDDLVWLWTSYRVVCREWRDTIEGIFRHRWLEKVYIVFDLNEVDNADIAEGDTSMLDYSHLQITTFRLEGSSEAKGGTIVTFQYHGLGRDEDDEEDEHDDDRDGQEYEKEEIRGLMKQYMRDRSIIRPCHYMWLNHMANDIELPAVSFDAKELQVTVDWQEMLHRLMYEERAYWQIYEKEFDGPTIEKKFQKELSFLHPSMEDSRQDAYDAYIDVLTSARLATRWRRIERACNKVPNMSLEDARRQVNDSEDAAQMWLDEARRHKPCIAGEIDSDHSDSETTSENDEDKDSDDEDAGTDATDD